MLILPGCILAAALTIGITLNRMIRKRITNHLTVEEATWQYIFINAVQGVPISLCLVVGLYWIVNTINIIEPLARVFSYVLFTVIILSITRVIARAVSGIIDMQIEHSKPCKIWDVESLHPLKYMPKCVYICVSKPFRVRHRTDSQRVQDYHKNSVIFLHGVIPPFSGP